MARATPKTEYYKTTQIDPTAVTTGSAAGSGIGAGIGAAIGSLPFFGGPGIGTLIGAGLGASFGGPIGTAAGTAIGEEEVEIPIGTEPGRYAPPGPSALSGLATQGWAWERVFSDMDKKSTMENKYAADLQALLQGGHTGTAPVPPGVGFSTSPIPPPYP